MKEIICLRSQGFAWSIEQKGDSFSVKRDEQELMRMDDLTVAIKGLLFLAPMKKASVQAGVYQKTVQKPKEKEQG